MLDEPVSALALEGVMVLTSNDAPATIARVNENRHRASAGGTSKITVIANENVRQVVAGRADVVSGRNKQGQKTARLTPVAFSKINYCISRPQFQKALLIKAINGVAVERKNPGNFSVE